MSEIFSAAQWMKLWAKASNTQAVQLSHDVDIACFGQQLTWSELLNLCQHSAMQLQQQGVQPDNRVLVVGKNEFELVLTYLACQWLGAVAVIVNRFPMPQLEAIAAQIGATHQYCLEGDEPLAHLAQLPPIEFSNLTQNSNIEPITSEIASIVLSSGSSGTPKALAHDSEAHCRSAQGVIELMQWSNKDNCLLSLPLYHVSGLALVWRWLVSGSMLSFGDLNTQFEQPVTVVSMVMTQLQRWLAGADKQPLKILLGGSYLEPSLIEKAQRSGAQCYLGYAMTEMASTITAKAFDPLPGSGRCLQYRELKINHQQIFVRGPMLAKGVLVDGRLVPLQTENDWYATGDMGRWQDNQLVVSGRKDNQFISGGENIHCEEVEQALMACGLLSQVMVIPIEDEEFGHRPVAAYVASEFNQSAIEQKLKTQLIKFKWPIAYFELPAHLLGGVKLNRKAVQDWISQQLR